MIKIYSHGNSDSMKNEFGIEFISMFELMFELAETTGESIFDQIDSAINRGHLNGFKRVGPFLVSDDMVFDFSDISNGYKVEFIKF